MSATFDAALRTAFEQGEELFAPSGKVVIAIPDITRPVNYTAVLGPLLTHLKQWDISIVVALGLHRPMTESELTPIKTVCGDLPVFQHDPDEASAIAHDSTVRYHPRIHDADLLVSVGVVEPHQYAGYSGGPKTFAIGCADRATISRLHSLEMLSQSTLSPGRLDRNAFHDELWKNVMGLPPLWTLVWVPGDASSVYWGPVKETFSKACGASAAQHFSEVAELAPWMHIQVPPSKASNFYQASRAASYVALVSSPAVVEGGWIVVEAACPEGIGEGSGERACAESMLRGKDALLADLDLPPERLPKTSGGAQRAYVLAMVLRRNPIALIGAPPMPELAAMGVHQFPSIEEARERLGLSGSGMTVEDPFHQLPVLGSS